MFDLTPEKRGGGLGQPGLAGLAGNRLQPLQLGLEQAVLGDYEQLLLPKRPLRRLGREVEEGEGQELGVVVDLWAGVEGGETREELEPRVWVLQGQTVGQQQVC